MKMGQKGKRGKIYIGIFCEILNFEFFGQFSTQIHIYPFQKKCIKVLFLAKGFEIGQK